MDCHTKSLNEVFSPTFMDLLAGVILSSSVLLFTTKFADTTRVLRNAAVAAAVISSTAGFQTKPSVASRADVPLPTADYAQNAVTSNVYECKPPSSVTVWEPPMHVTNPINSGDDPDIFNVTVNEKFPLW